jgi:hypothetical protein
MTRLAPSLCPGSSVGWLDCIFAQSALKFEGQVEDGDGTRIENIHFVAL